MSFTRHTMGSTMKANLPSFRGAISQWWLGRLPAVLFILLVGQVKVRMNAESVSNLKPDERIVFFSTDAALSEDGNHWVVPIHVWVHEFDNVVIRRTGFAAAFRSTYGLKATPDTRANFEDRVRLIGADNERGKRIVVEIADRKLELPETEPNGHAIGRFKLDKKFVEQNADSGSLNYSAIFPRGDVRTAQGFVRIVPRDGISVISDFDDTVKVTHATDRESMLRHTLYLDFESVPGMADLYTDWSRRGALIHFVSSSPWHLYECFDDFLSASGFPKRTMSLKHFRFKDKTLMNLFRKGTETKPRPDCTHIAGIPVETVHSCRRHRPRRPRGLCVRCQTLSATDQENLPSQCDRCIKQRSAFFTTIRRHGCRAMATV